MDYELQTTSWSCQCDSPKKRATLPNVSFVRPADRSTGSSARTEALTQAMANLVERTYDDAQDHTIRLPARLGGLST